MRKLLGEWAQGFVLQVDPTARDHAPDIVQAQMWVTQFPNSGRHLVVELSLKLARDELCAAWGWSPVR